MVICFAWLLCEKIGVKMMQRRQMTKLSFCLVLFTKLCYDFYTLSVWPVNELGYLFIVLLVFQRVNPDCYTIQGEDEQYIRRGKMKKRCIIFVLLLCLLVGSVSFQTSIEADGSIIQERFIVMLMQEMGLVKATDSKNSILKQAYAKKVVKEEEKGILLDKLSKERAAVYLERVDKLVHGAQYDKELYQVVLRKNRISDLRKIKKSNRASVIKVFCKGIMVGYSNGYYIQSRKFSGKSLVTLSEAKTYAARLKYPQKRRLISKDGQVIRTTKLPKNYKSYSYILETYPNSFYEKKFEYQKTTYVKKPVELVDYACPAKIGKMKFYNGMTMESVMDKYLETWCEKVERNMKLRFNVDYRTIDNEWVSQLRSTYYMNEEDALANKKRTDEIKDYVAMVKKNKVVVKCSRVTVEPSTLYNKWDDYVRVYVKFKIVSGKMSFKESIYCSASDVTGIKKNIWKTCCFDLPIGSLNRYSVGSDYAVIDNDLLLA